MRTSQKGIDLIKVFEGFRSEAYLCPGLVWTIGYGHTEGVREGNKVTKEKAEELLREDLIEFEDHVKRLVKIELSQNQFDALVSLVYNIGPGNFHTSTIRRLINEGCKEKSKLEHAWKMWKRGGGKTLPGLVKRRAAEFELYSDVEK